MEKRTFHGLAIGVILAMCSFDVMAKCNLYPELFITYDGPGVDSLPLTIPGEQMSTYLPTGGSYTVWVRVYYDPICGPFFLRVIKDGELISEEALPNYGQISAEFVVTEPGTYEFRAHDYWTLNEFSVNVVSEPDEVGPLRVSMDNLFLHGALSDTGTQPMNTDLLALQVLPMTGPYASMGWQDPTPTVETLAPFVLGNVNHAVVDWVRLELRSVAEPGIAVAARSAILTRWGNVRQCDGQDVVTFNAPPGWYHVAIRHRNHLGILTEPVFLPGLPNHIVAGVADLPMVGLDTRVPMPNGSMALRPGNAFLDEGPQRISYVGNDNDRDAVLLRVGGSTPLAVISGYYNEDVNLDGVVKYTGANNDRDVILQAIGGNIPTEVIFEHLP